MRPERRQDVVERLGYCTNCLARSHNIRSCTSMETCRKCNKLHHTLLHQPSQTTTTGLSATSSSPRRQHQTPQHHPRTAQPRHQQRQPESRHHRQQQPRQSQRQQEHRLQRQQQSRRQQQQQHRHHQRRLQQHRHRHYRQQQRHQSQQPPAPINSPTTSATPAPNQHILAEAIKSLANVLCYQSKSE